MRGRGSVQRIHICTKMMPSALVMKMATPITLIAISAAAL